MLLLLDTCPLIFDISESLLGLVFRAGYLNWKQLRWQASPSGSVGQDFRREAGVYNSPSLCRVGCRGDLWGAEWFRGTCNSKCFSLE